MKAILAFLLCSLYIVVVSSYTCDYNVTSITQYRGLNQATFAPSTTICWAPGVYSFTMLTVSAAQTWIGPQADMDPTCNRIVNPPCDRLLTASSQNATVEAIFSSTSLEISSIANFTVNGFTIVNAGELNAFLHQSVATTPLFVSNNYWYLSNVNSGVGGNNVYFVNNYVTSTSASSASIVGYIAYNFFYGTSAITQNTAVSGIVIEHNTIILGGTCITSTHPFSTKANLIVGCTNFGILDYATNSNHTSNVILYSDKGLLYQGTGTLTGKLSNNCFADEPNAVDLWTHSLSSGTEINKNYWGDKTGPNYVINYNSISPQSGRGTNILAPSSSFLSSFTFETQPVKVPSPYVCPGHMVDISVKPHTFKTGYNTTIYWSFTLNPQLVAVGLTADLYNNTQLTFTIGSIPNDVFYYRGSALSCSPTITFDEGDLSVNGSCVVYVNMNNLPSGLSPTNNYTLIATASETTVLPYFTSSAHTPINVIPVLPLGCWKNLTQTLNIPKVLQLNGPVSLTLANFSCNQPGFIIQALDSNQNTLNAVLQSGEIVFTITQEGVYVLGLTITPNNDADTIFTGRATLNIEIDNHAPIAGSPTITYPKTRTTPLPSWNVLDYCSDQDGDTLTTLQIQPTKAWAASDVQQLSTLQLYFITEKVVVTVSSQGNITLSAPVINGNNVTPGGPVPTYWIQNIGFQYQITDGDRKNSNAWGTIHISHS